ncbi:VOC family protein [Undibacterium fentianense]|uniref:VOC family protein n=1 Tax=Undibacterium fentianense TaxID=2828728 RepID=A0A941DZR5_9BURK|nr:VOC family protein [Undibacterium fentianense]MBR7799745.1 VOC family protein [Undibacterium fentianense]
MSLSVLLFCTDLEQTRRFYSEILGFDVVDLNTSSFRAIKGRATDSFGGGSQITSKSASHILFTSQDLWRTAPQLSGTIYLTIDDIDDYFRAVKEHVNIAWTLQDMPYGTREFAIRDCNGYYLAFVQGDA